jgi:hypothetical protein
VGLSVGASSWPCCFVNWVLPIACGKFARISRFRRHLGVSIAPSRSTLAYANRHRPWKLYQTVFLELLARCQEVAHNGRRKFRFKNKLLSLDATVIDLCSTLYDWAKFRRTKGAMKLHLLRDHDGYLPRFAVITDGNTHELKVVRKLRWEETWWCSTVATSTSGSWS